MAAGDQRSATCLSSSAARLSESAATLPKGHAADMFCGNQRRFHGPSALRAPVAKAAKQVRGNCATREKTRKTSHCQPPPHAKHNGFQQMFYATNAEKSGLSPVLGHSVFYGAARVTGKTQNLHTSSWPDCKTPSPLRLLQTIGG